jgi:hypothetical protein
LLFFEKVAVFVPMEQIFCHDSRPSPTVGKVGFVVPSRPLGWFKGEDQLPNPQKKPQRFAFKTFEVCPPTTQPTINRSLSRRGILKEEISSP